MRPDTSESTTLNLLTRDGAVSATFAAQLTEDQYARLLAYVHDAQTRQELTESILVAANEWGLMAIIEV